MRVWGLRKREEKTGKMCILVCLVYVLLENMTGAVTTPILCSWGRQSVMVMKQLMIHTLLSKVVKGTLALPPWTTCAIVLSWLSLTHMFSTVSFSQLHSDVTTRIHSIFVFSLTLLQDDPALKKIVFQHPLLVLLALHFNYVPMRMYCKCVCPHVSVSKCLTVAKVFLFSISGFSVETDAHAGLCVFSLCLNLSLPNLCIPLNLLPLDRYHEDYSIKQC